MIDSKQEIQVLNQLISAQNKLHIFPTTDKMCEFAVEVFKNLPGVELCNICLRFPDGSCGDCITETLKIQNALSKFSESENHFSLPLPEVKNLLSFELNTSNRQFGYIFAKINDVESFRPFKSAANNFSNVFAILLENKWQKELLISHHEKLEEKVITRTSELKNEFEKPIDVEKKLAFQHSIMLGIMESTSDLIFSVDKNYCYTSFNKNHSGVMKTIYGAEIEIGKSVLEYMSVEEDRRKAKKNIDWALAGEIFSEESISGDKLFSQLYFDITHFPIYDSEGKCIGVAIKSENITERKRSEIALQESKARLSFHDINSPLANIEWDTNFIVTRWTGAAENIFGWTEAETVGKPISDLNMIHEEDISIVQQTMEKLTSGIETQVVSGNRNYTKTGKIIYCEWYNSVLLDQNGKMVSVMSRVLDVTERVNSELSLSESEEKYRLLHEAAGVGIGYYSPEGIVISYNTIAAKNMKGNPEDFTGKSLFDLFPKSEAEFYLERIKKAALTKRPQIYEDKVDLPSGVRWFSSVYSRIVDTNNTVAGIQIISTDITDQKLAEEQQQNLNEQLNRIASNVPGAIYEFCLKPDGTISIPYASEGFSSIYGLTPEEVKTDATPLFQCIHPDDSEHLNQSISESAEKLIPWHNENRIILPSGEIKWIEGKSTPQKLADGSIIWQGYINDVTERKLAEEELKLSEERFEKSFKLSPYLVSLTSMDGKVIEVNDMIFDTFGYTREEFLGNNTTELPIWVNPHERNAFIAQLKQDGILREMEVKYRKKTGEIGDYLLSACIIEVNDKKILLSIIHNISDRKQKEKALQESEAKFRATAEFSPLAIYASSGPDQKGEYINPAFFKIFGFTLEDVPTVGEWWIKAFPDDKYRQWVMDTWQKNIDDAILNNTNVRALECVCNCKDGSQKIISWEGSNVGDQFWAFGLDLTERVKAEEALKESEELLRLSSELANVAAWEFDFTTNSMTRSKNHDSLYGLEFQEKWEFETFLNATHPDDREMSNAMIQKSVAIGGPDEYKFDFRVVYPDQSIHWLNVIGKVIVRNSEGTGTLVRGFLLDINDRKLAEEIIRKKDSEFRKLSANVPDLIFQFTRKPDGTYVVPVASEGIINIFGCSPEDVKDDFSPIARVIHPDDAVRVINDIEYSANNLTHFTCEFRVQIPGKPVQWIYSRSSPEKLEDGSITWYGFNTNITELKQAEEAIKESEEKFKSSFYTNPAAQAILTQTGKFVESNDAFSKLIGFTNEQIVGKSPVDLGILSLKERNKLAAHAKASGGIVRNAEVKFTVKDGSFRNVLYSVEQILLNGIPHRLSMGIDITERKQAEEKIRKLNEELEKRVIDRTNELSNTQMALVNLVEDLNEKTVQLEKSSKMLQVKNKELETFSYSVSHDLKAPLRGIDGYSRLLEEIYSDQLNDEARQFIKTIREGTKQMNQLIEDLLAYSRLERASYRSSAINSVEFIDQIVSLYKADIETKNISIEKDISDCKIFADNEGLAIALRNIIENAIKFSGMAKKPKIKIVLKENISSWIISVEDNGIGFDMKYHKRIFEIFQRLNLPEQFSGTGIGLAMVQKSVERMDGKIWAESEVGKGAKFYIEISKK